MASRSSNLHMMATNNAEKDCNIKFAILYTAFIHNIKYQISGLREATDPKQVISSVHGFCLLQYGYHDEPSHLKLFRASKTVSLSQYM